MSSHRSRVRAVLGVRLAYAVLRSATRVTPLFAAGGVTRLGAGLTVAAVHLAGIG